MSPCRRLPLFVCSAVALAALLLPGCTSVHRLPVSQSAGAVIAAAEGRARVVDLTQPLDETSTFYPNMFPALATTSIPVASVITPVNLGLRIFPGGSPFVLRESSRGLAPHFTMGEHTGTHMDAPNHFIALGRDIDRTPLDDLIRPAAILDIRDHAAADARFPVDADYVRAWEEQHGEIPRGAMVFLLTGLTKRAGDRHTDHPGFTVSAANYLREARDISGVGTDSLSPDISGRITFPVHKRLLSDECLIMENVENLDQLPPLGSQVLMGPLPIAEGSGSPTRILGIIPAGPTGGLYESLDLTHRLDKRMPFVPGRDPLYSDLDIPVLDDINPIEIKLQLLPHGLPIDRETTAKPVFHGYHNGYFSMGVSTGTHVRFPSDAASHAPERLLAPVAICDVRDAAPSAALEARVVLDRLAGQSLRGAFVVLHTGHDDSRKGETAPGLSPEAAQALLDQGVVGVLSDGPCLDPTVTGCGPATDLVLQSGALAGGFLRDPGRLSREARLAILPLPIRGSQAAPARIFAFQPTAR